MLVFSCLSQATRIIFCFRVPVVVTLMRASNGILMHTHTHNISANRVRYLSRNEIQITATHTCVCIIIDSEICENRFNGKCHTHIKSLLIKSLHIFLYLETERREVEWVVEGIKIENAVLETRYYVDFIRFVDHIPI